MIADTKSKYFISRPTVPSTSIREEGMRRREGRVESLSEQQSMSEMKESTLRKFSILPLRLLLTGIEAGGSALQKKSSRGKINEVTELWDASV